MIASDEDRFVTAYQETYGGQSRPHTSADHAAKRQNRLTNNLNVDQQRKNESSLVNELARTEEKVYKL